MKKKITSQLRIVFVLLVTLFLNLSCSLLDKDTRQETSNIPATYGDRPVEVQGTINVSSKEVTFKTWDSGQIDGDIITLVVDGKVILSNYSLLGTKKSIAVTLDNLGYNYVMLYAHNEGSISPNTAALSVTDKAGNEKELVLSANLSTNAAYNIVVQ